MILDTKPLAMITSERATDLRSQDHVKLLLERIEADRRPGGTRAVIEVNPHALEEARQLDQEWARGWRRGPLHGLPVLVKDNIDTAAPLHTTAGSLALAGTSPAQDAPVVRNLRAAGMVVLGKTNLSEWSNYRSTHSISGWSAIGGLTYNPHDRSRSAGGSSSGSGAAVAASLAPIAVGTETDGSIICPAAFCGVVGLKPTVGIVPTDGVIPISRSQDVVGPMTRTVRDAALALGAMMGDPGARRFDPGPPQAPAQALRGMRIGLPRPQLWTSDSRVNDVVEEAVAALARLGATVVDSVKIDSMTDFDAADEACVLDHELKVGLAQYLATRPGISVRTLNDLIAFNRAHADVELGRFDQDVFERAERTQGLGAAEYLAARERCLTMAKTNGLDRVMQEETLDALVLPSADLAFAIKTNRVEATQGDEYLGDRDLGATSLPAMAGYPMLTVPCGVVDGLPVGLGLIGLARHEQVLLRIGHLYEIATFGPAGSAAAFPPPR